MNYEKFATWLEGYLAGTSEVTSAGKAAIAAKMQALTPPQYIGLIPSSRLVKNLIP